MTDALLDGPAVQPAAPQLPSVTAGLTMRRVKSHDGTETDFPFLVIDKPELWPIASTFKAHVEVPLTNDRNMKVPITGIPLSEWEAIEARCPIKHIREDLTPEEKKQAMVEYERSVDAKRVEVFEAATGQKVPGVSREEKIDWLRQRGSGVTGSLFISLHQVAAGFKKGELLDTYSAAIMGGGVAANKDSDADFTLESFNDWKSAVDIRYFFRHHREGGDCILEIPLKGMSQERRQEIDSQTEEPEAPKVPKRDPRTKRFDHKLGLEPNITDPAWLQAVRAVNQRRLTLYVQECLCFTMPGNTLEEKYAWLSSHIVGEVTALRDYIENEIIGYGGRYSFF